MYGKERLIWADSMKGWLMILVILGHAIQSTLGNECFDNHVWNFIYSFHMPTFMAISGWFAFRQNLRRGGYLIICKRRVCQLLIPYLLWSLFSLLLHGRLNLRSIWNVVLYPDSSFWFLWILFLISVVFIICQYLAWKINCDEFLFISLAGAILFALMVVFEIRVFGFQFLSYYFLFYTAGYCIHRFALWQKIRNKIVLTSLFLFWCLLAWYWNMHMLPTWMPVVHFLPSSLLQYTYRGVTAIVAILFIFGVAPWELNNMGRFNLFIKEIGTISLGLYVCHLTFMGGIVRILNAILPQVGTIGIIILAFVIGFALSFAIVELLKCNKYTAKYLLGKLE